MRDSTLIWWQLFLPSCRLRYWAVTPSPFMPLDTFPPSITDIFASKFVQLTTPTIALTDHPRVRYNMNRPPDEEEQHDAYLNALQREGKFVIRWMAYPNASYLANDDLPPKFGAGHHNALDFNTFAEAHAHWDKFDPATKIQTKVVTLTKDGGFRPCEDTIDEPISVPIASWLITFSPHLIAEKQGVVFSGFLPTGVTKDICLEFARVAKCYRKAVALAQELSSNPSPSRVREIRSILDAYQADAENLL